MRGFRIRSDLQRRVVGGYALPLGIDADDIQPPRQGYTLNYTQGEDDEPDTYAFHVVVSHERLGPIVHRAFELLPDQVYGIVEIGSRDAYRSMDVYIGEGLIPVEDFLATWQHFEPILMEDGSIAAGANSDDPFIELFLDQWKGLSIHVPLEMRDEVEAMLQSFGLEEVQETWPHSKDDDLHGQSQVRPILELVDDFSPDIDELLLQLRHEWKLELNIDPQTNVDEGGRNLGLTLWHAVVVVEDAAGDSDVGAYASIWATASSLGGMETLIESALREFSEWKFSEIYTIDRVAYDERPEELADLPPRRREAQVHLVQFERWAAPSEEKEGG
jgi:hypothetical protein